MTDFAALLERRREIIRTRAHRRVVGQSRLIMPSDFATPGALAHALDPSTVQTPALTLIDDALVAVQRHMDGEDDGIDRLIITMPPQEGKSERVTHYGALWWLKRNPNLRIGLVSYGDDIVKRHSYAIRNDIVTNDGTEDNLNLGLRLRRDTKAAGRWNLDYPHKGGIYATSIGGGFTGRPADALIIDDPVKDFSAAESVFLSKKAWDWWGGVARPRLAPGAPVVVVLTRWHELDLAGRLLLQQLEDAASGRRNFDRWTVINIPAKADFDPATEVDILGRQPGEYMESARQRTREQWEATEAATPEPMWVSLYQGRPSPKEGDVWKKPWWRRYEQALWTREAGGVYRVVEPFDLMVQSWDMSFKDTAAADFVVGQVWMLRGVNSYLLDQVNARLGFTDTIAEFEALSKKWPQSTTKLVEDKANGSAVIDALKDKIPGILAVNPTDSKYGRAVAVSPFIRAGNVHVPKKHPDVALFDIEALIVEAASFPNGTHDDQVDATSQALRHLYLEGHGISAVEMPVGRVPSTRPSGPSVPDFMSRMNERQRITR